MNNLDAGIRTKSSSKDKCVDTRKKAKKGFFAKRFSKKSGTTVSGNGETKEYLEEDVSACLDEMNETAQKRGFFKSFKTSKQKEISTRIIGKTVLLSEEELDDVDEFCPKKTEKIQNAESFVAQKIQQMQTNSHIKDDKVQTIDIETTETKAENNKSTQILNSRGVMTFDGMADEEDIENELYLENNSDDNKERKNLNFIKAPENYDPVASGFYKPVKREKQEIPVEEKESVEIVKQDGVCCAVWD